MFHLAIYLKTEEDLVWILQSSNELEPLKFKMNEWWFHLNEQDKALVEFFIFEHVENSNNLSVKDLKDIYTSQNVVLVLKKS